MRRLAVIVLAACGGKPQPPATPVDGDVDAPADADEAARVDVHVIYAPGPRDPLAAVIFMDDTGAFVSDGAVDANGDAHGYLPRGGSVTTLVVSIDDELHHYDSLTTIRGVKPGDHLTTGSPPPPTRTGAMTSMTVSYPPPPVNNVSYALPCGNGGIGPPGSVVLDFYASCVQPTFDLMIFVNDGSRDFMWQPDVPYADGSTVALSGTWQAETQAAVTLSNVPGNVARAGATLYTLVGGIAVETGQQSIELPSPGTLEVSAFYPPNAGRGSIVSAGALVGGAGTDFFVTADTASPASYAFDLLALPLPRPGHVVQTTSGASWTELDGGSGDLRVVGWPATWVELGNGIPHQLDWALVEDPAQPTTAATLPSLPDAYATEDPTKQLNLVIPHPGDPAGAAVVYVEYDNLDGYDAARPYGAQLTDITSRFPTLNHTAHVRYSP